MKSALVVYGGLQVHQPQQCAEIFSRQLEGAGLTVEVSDTLDAFSDYTKLRSFDLVVPAWTQAPLSGEQLQPLLTAVMAGTGIGGWHGGMGDTFRGSTSYKFMVGDQWIAHPGGEQVRYRVRISSTASPITAGLSDFYVTSEQNYMHVDPGATVLATTHFPLGTASNNGFSQAAQDRVDADVGEPHVVMPVTWTKRYGKGRVFYCSLGHEAKVFEAPEPLTVVTRGLLWAAGRESR